MSPFEISILFFLQLAVILGACRLVGWGAAKAGQSQVVSEMIAGVLLGPSLLGWLAPGLSAELFPKASMPVVFSVCQIGLVLYMFLVGLEFNIELIQKRFRSAASVSAAGIAVPFALGALLAWAVFGHEQLFSGRATVWEAVLFMGASMSITAFPMLARIIHERGIAGTSLGTLALAAGSMDDAAAWCVLALVLASFQRDLAFAVRAIGGGLLYAVVLLTVGRRLLARLGDAVEKRGTLGPDLLTLILMLVMAGAWFTDYIRIYAVFGAFLMGVAMPRGLLVRELERQLGPLTINLLLPLFFVYSGLNTRIGLIAGSGFLWLVALAAFLAATLGKGVACWAAARLNGEPNREALAIGTLMNARGLMELIILNIGLERGLIEPGLFTIMVLMAIVTTLMATPIFEWVYKPKAPILPAAIRSGS